AVDRAYVNTSRVLSADAGFANYVSSHYAVLLPQSSYWIFCKLNENAGSNRTVIVPFHFLFATTMAQIAKIARTTSVSEEQSGNNLQQYRARYFAYPRLIFGSLVDGDL
ncbi:MAG: hypothetical protein J2P21_28745, partial [Chloracidobacterium sp.]|nr:hypothetical protein [Chloracidobacterium sp.]